MTILEQHLQGQLAARAHVSSVARPSVVFLCSTSDGIRNVERSGMKSHLESSGIAAHLLTGPQARRSMGYAGDGDSSSHEFIFAPPVRSQLAKSAVSAILAPSFARRHGLTSYFIYTRWKRRSYSLLRRARNSLTQMLSIIGSQTFFYQWQIDYLERLDRGMYQLDAIKRQLQDLRPTLIVSTSCVAYDEKPYLLAAQELGIPTLGCIRSFDNLTSRSILPSFDHYAVWNERMRDQLLAFYPASRSTGVAITGTPQFDFHVREAFCWSREHTLGQLGLQPGERYLLYATNRSVFTPTEPETVAEFARRCDRTPELRGHRIVVRPHPGDDFGRWQQLAADHPRVVVNLPWNERDQISNQDVQARLVNTLRYADVCINFASTMSLDAAIVDTPVICVAFTQHPGSPEERFVREAYQLEHYRPIVESGGVRVAYDMEQLVAAAASYVSDRSRDRALRARLVAAECGQVDGHSAQRVAGLIEQLVTAAPSRTAHA